MTVLVEANIICTFFWSKMLIVNKHNSLDYVSYASSYSESKMIQVNLILEKI